MILYEASTVKILPTRKCGFFIFATRFIESFFYFANMGGYMQLEIIENPDESQIVIYKIARVVFAETYMPTLAAVEALVSMIQNVAKQFNRDISEVIKDENLFGSIKSESSRHNYLSVDVNDRAFQMCLRVVKRMMHGTLPDKCFGAVRFHRADEMPDWAVSRGYIADVDGLLFYTWGE